MLMILLILNPFLKQRTTVIIIKIQSMIKRRKDGKNDKNTSKVYKLYKFL